MDDSELLDRYGRDGDQEAFAELVRRHSEWIYPSARRQLRDAHLAEDVTQAVFLLLARKAGGISARSNLGGWLFGTLRYCVKEAGRQRFRQRERVKEVAQMKQDPDSEANWELISPVLDGAIGRLRRSDREAVLLRFYEQKPLAEVGRLMGVSEEAARKRVDRAVGKLRGMLEKQGVTGTSAGLSAVLVGSVVQEVPARVVEGVMAAVGGSGSAMAGGIAKGAMKMMARAKVKVAAMVVGVFFAAGVMVAQAASSTQAASGTQDVSVSRPIVPMVDAEKDALLQDLQRVRAATRAAVVSGRGTAHLETSEERAPQLAEANPSLATHAVQFAFRGNESLVTGGVAYNATAMLATDSQFIRYYAGVAGRPAPAAVSIYRPEYMIFSADVPNWSFQELSRLPRSLSHDDLEPQLFAAMTMMPEAHVEKTGSVVLVRVELPKPPMLRRDLRVLEFDLALGGMLTHYRYETTDNRDGHKEDSMEDWRLAWSNTKGVVTPSRRVAVTEFRRDGKLNQRYGSRIGFDTFVTEDVPAEELTIDHMGVLPGTPVVDQIKNCEWRYGN